MVDIKFGTDGWRGIIAEDFTFYNIKRVAQAIADYLAPPFHERAGRVSGKQVAVGYDTRFMSREFANLVADVLSGNSIKTIVSDSPSPSQMLSYFVKHRKLDGGVMITASHNPSIYNGIKFKEPFGCSSLPSTTDRIESLIDKSTPQQAARYFIAKGIVSVSNTLCVSVSNTLCDCALIPGPIKRGGAATAVPRRYKSAPKMTERSVTTEDISRPYLSALKKYLIPKYMEKRSLRIVVDSMYGAGGFYLENILKGFGHKVITIHGKPNPLFPGLNPEPIDVHLKELSKKVKDVHADIGIATDGDADRVGIVDNKGNVITPHYVLSLLLIHLKTTRKWGGAVAKTISSTSLIDKIAGKYNIPVKETPVGFKHIAELMLSSDILIGGEESGGNGFKNHIPERDGFLSGLLLVEMMGARCKKVTELVQDMEREFGRYRYKRVDVPRPCAQRRGEHTTHKKIKKFPNYLSGNKVVDIKTFDGTKFILQNGAWLLIRASGTEPILRIYAEAPTKKQVTDLIDAAKKTI